MPLFATGGRGSGGARRAECEPLESRTLLTGLTGQYFDRVDFTNLKLTRTDATVDFTWPAAPNASMSADHFSARWRGQVEPQFGETYTFYVTSDDGVRLWVDGRLLIDNWVNQGPTERSAQVALDAGQRYDIRLDYYEFDLSAQVRLSWSSASQPKQVIPSTRLFPSPSGLTGTYFDNADFTAQALTRNDAAVNFDWDAGSPHPSIGADTFSARWTGQFVPQFSETYAFFAGGDSTVRLRVDGELLVDTTSVQDGGEIRLEAGKRYDVQFDYVSQGGDAFAALEWSSPSQPRQVIPNSRLFTSVATAIPSRRADYTNAVLNADRPDPGVIFADGFYWMVHTTGGVPGWPLYKSADMTSWTFVKHLLTTSNKPAFMTDAFWAPEIHKIGNQFVLTGTSWSNQYNHLVVALATAPEIDGPYTVQPTPIVSDTRHVLDSHIFQEHDGRVYMLWKRDGPSNGQFGTIRIREMNAGGTAFLPGSSAVTILDNSVGGWERNLAEAPWMIRRGGFYYLFYSGGFIDTTYSLGVARATSPLGPFTRSPANPIITNNATWAGPGHGGFALDRDGIVWHLYHARHASDPGFGRVQVLDRVIWGADGWPTFGNGGTVSTRPQPGPIVDAASGAGLLTLVGDLTAANQNDVFRVVRGTSDASMLDVFINGTLARSAPFGEIQQLTIDGRGGNDTLFLDYSYGEAIPGAGIRFFGSGGSDAVRLVGAGGGDAFRYAGGQFSHGTGLVTLSGIERFLLENGSFAFNGDAAGAAVEVSAAAEVLFNVSQQLAGLTVSGGGRVSVSSAGATRTVSVDGASFSIDATATLDLGDNALVLRSGGSGDAAQAAARRVAGYLKTGLESGGAYDWLGTGVSSTAAAAANAAAGSVLYGLGVVQNNHAAAGTPDGTTTDATPGNEIYTSFNGRTVGLNDVLVGYTYMGDADLDGSVTGTDYSLIDGGFSFGLSGWLNGDFDYSGSIDGTDYALIDNAFAFQTGTLSTSVASIWRGEGGARKRVVEAVLV